MAARPSKRLEILRAAMELFTRDGFMRTSMDAVADRAGVTKQTVYNNFQDKEALFDAASTTVLDELTAGLDEVFRGMPDEPGDPEAELTEMAVRWARAFLHPRAAALRRLVIAEVGHHPELLHRWVAAGPGRVDARLVSLLERWHAAGLLDIPDPSLAARQLRLLVTAEPWNRSLFGTRRLTDDEIRELVEPNVRLFLRAFHRQ